MHETEGSPISNDHHLRLFTIGKERINYKYTRNAMQQTFQIPYILKKYSFYLVFEYARVEHLKADTGTLPHQPLI